jgi:hypothetical protein
MSDTDTDTDTDGEQTEAFDPEQSVLQQRANEIFDAVADADESGQPDTDAAHDHAQVDTSDANPGGGAALTGPQEDAYDPIQLYEQQRHRNGDETALLVCSFGDGYQLLAFDVDAGGQLLEVETVGDTQDSAKAVGMAEYWLEQNPDGVLGGAPVDGGGFLEKLGFGGDE